jgi:hypothetical protein
MPHFKCETCRTRRSIVGEGTPVCEECGAPLEPVTELTELVGYRATASSGDGTPGTSERFAAAVAAALPKR